MIDAPLLVGKVEEVVLIVEEEGEGLLLGLVSETLMAPLVAVSGGPFLQRPEAMQTGWRLS